MTNTESRTDIAEMGGSPPAGHLHGRTVHVLLCLALIAAGCKSHPRIRTDELSRLDGFRAGDEIVIYDMVGRPILFHADRYLSMVFHSGVVFADRYVLISIKDGVFRGRCRDGKTVVFELEKIRYATVSVFSGFKSIGVPAIIVGGVVLILTLIILLLFAAGAGG